jgi:hypothetical protein
VHSVISEHSYINVITTGYATINKLDNKTIKEFLFDGPGAIYDYFKKRNELNYALFNSSCICIKKTSFDEAGLFREDITHGPDTDMWSRLARYNQFWMIPEVLSFYVQDAENRVMNRLPDVRNTRIYNFDTSFNYSDDEKKYTKRCINDFIFTSVAQGDYRRGYIMYKKHSNFVGITEILGYFISKFSAKIKRGNTTQVN